MKFLGIFILLIYWSLIIFAPVLAKNKEINKKIEIYSKSKVDY